MQGYVQRSLKKRLLALLGQFPAVAILGPRQCGKSTLAREILSFSPQALYEGLGDKRNWFIIIDVGTSVVSGLLAGLQGSVNNCGTMLIANAATYSAYAIALIALKPYENKYEQYFFSGVALAQAAALTAQAIVHGTASEETADEVRPVAQGIVLSTEILLSIKSMFDVIRRISTQAKNIFNFFTNKPVATTTTNLQELAAPLIPDTNNRAESDVGSIDSDEVRGTLQQPTEQELAKIAQELAELDPYPQQPEATGTSSRSSSIDRDVADLCKATPPNAAPAASAASSRSTTPALSQIITRSSTPDLTEKIGTAHRSGGNNPFEMEAL